MTKTAIIYARVSSARQAEDELPIQSQVDQCRSKAQSLGADIVHEFLDEGRSGRTDKPALIISGRAVHSDRIWLPEPCLTRTEKITVALPKPRRRAA